MKTILIPTDFSTNARHAAQYALTQFGASSAQFILLNAYDPPRPTGMLINLDDIVKKEAINDLNNEIALLKREGEMSGELTSEAVLGDTSEVIERVANDKKADLIVMGTKGASGLKELLIGSNTAKLIKTTTKPVLAVPESCENKVPKQILLATDYNQLNDLSVLSTLRKIAKRFDATIHIVNVVHNENGKFSFNPVLEKYALNEFFTGIPHHFHMVENESVEEGLNQFSEQHNIDLIALVPGKNNFFDTVFHRSVTNKIAQHSKIPFLVLH
jgi:nucleotide-binding universal stress UspA family protein